MNRVVSKSGIGSEQNPVQASVVRAQVRPLQTTERAKGLHASGIAAKPKQRAQADPARRKKNLLRLAAAGYALALCLGNLFLADIRSDWYAELAKPIFCPPILVLFALYAASVILLGAGYAFVLTRSTGIVLRVEYLFNGLLQLLWTLFFFRLRAVFAALVVLTLLTLHTFFLLKYTRRAVGNVAFLMLGHFLRVAFCFLLNYSIMLLN